MRQREEEAGEGQAVNPLRSIGSWPGAYIQCTSSKLTEEGHALNFERQLTFIVFGAILSSFECEAASMAVLKVECTRHCGGGSGRRYN